MVRIDDVLGLSLLVIASSTLLKSSNGDPYSLKKLQTTPRQFYKVQTDFNLENIARIENARERLISLSDTVRSKTLSLEKQKVEQQKALLQSSKSEYGALLSQLEKLVRSGQQMESYSPRIRGIIMRKKGYDPVDYEAIERGKKAGGFIPGIQNIINTIDQNILKLNKSYSSLESI